MPPGSPINSIAGVDQPGARIATRRGAAYCLWLERNIKNAKLVLSDGADGPFDQFVAAKLEAYASLRPQLLTDVNKLPGSKILPSNLYDRAAGDRDGEAEHRRRGVLTCVKAEAKPRLDGRLDEPVWQRKPAVLQSAEHDDGQWPGVVMFAHDAEFLYVGRTAERHRAKPYRRWGHLPVQKAVPTYRPMTVSKC